MNLEPFFSSINHLVASNRTMFLTIDEISQTLPKIEDKNGGQKTVSPIGAPFSLDHLPFLPLTVNPGGLSILPRLGEIFSLKSKNGGEAMKKNFGAKLNRQQGKHGAAARLVNYERGKIQKIIHNLMRQGVKEEGAVICVVAILGHDIGSKSGNDEASILQMASNAIQNSSINDIIEHTSIKMTKSGKLVGTDANADSSLTCAVQSTNPENGTNEALNKMTTFVNQILSMGSTEVISANDVDVLMTHWSDPGSLLEVIDSLRACLIKSGKECEALAEILKLFIPQKRMSIGSMHWRLNSGTEPKRLKTVTFGSNTAKAVTTKNGTSLTESTGAKNGAANNNEPVVSSIDALRQFHVMNFPHPFWNPSPYF